MKKAMLIFLFITGTAILLRAQEKYDLLFNSPAPGSTNISFTFQLPDQKKIVFEFSYLSQLEQLPNLDSLVKVALQALNPLKDSLRADGIVRRVDVSLINPTVKMRIVSHPELSNSYAVQDKELVQLKVNQDTIRISSVAGSRREVRVNQNGVISSYHPKLPFTIMILVNNIADASSLPDTVMQQCINILRPNVLAYYRWDKAKNYEPLKLDAFFNLQTGKALYPISPMYKQNFQTPFKPIVGFSMTATRGSFVPSFQAGFELQVGNSYFYNKWRLFMETQSFFSRDAVTNKLKIDNNSFLTFQLLQNSIRSKQTSGFTLEGNITFGYLIGRSGEWYEPNTFRFGLPVFVNKHIMIEPQFTFNGWFRNMSPSIKLSINF